MVEVSQVTVSMLCFSPFLREVVSDYAMHFSGFYHVAVGRDNHILTKDMAEKRLLRGFDDDSGVILKSMSHTDTQYLRGVVIMVPNIILDPYSFVLF